jgi:CheY-like chemotaxis protein
MIQRPTVLIAEDDPVFRRVSCFTVSKCGVQVEAVGDGATALQRLLAGGIDFLVTDHEMPGLSGVEVLEQVASSGTAVPPTILCTAKGLELDSQGLTERFDLVAVIHKPFSPRRLNDLIVGHLHLGPERQEAARAKRPQPPSSPAVGPTLPGSSLGSPWDTGTRSAEGFDRG